MGGKNEAGNVDETKNSAAAGGEAATPAKEEKPEFKPVAALQPKEKAPPAKEEKTPAVAKEEKTEKAPAEGAKAKKLGADDDDIPEDAELLELSPSALKRRLDRHTKAELRQRFGTDKADEIKAKLDRLSELEKAEEDRAREALTEKERLEGDLKKSRELHADAERRLRMLEDDRVIEKQSDRISKILTKHLDIDDEDDRDVIYKKLARWLKNEYSEEQLVGLKDGVIEKWAKDFAKDNPKRAREVKAAVQKVPATNGADTREQEAPNTKSGTGNTQRNFSPSAENAMTSREARAEAGKQGLRW